VNITTVPYFRYNTLKINFTRSARFLQLHFNRNSPTFGLNIHFEFLQMHS